MLEKYLFAVLLTILVVMVRVRKARGIQQNQVSKLAGISNS